MTRGTRQGCPLSPPLFSLAMEPSSIALRSTSLWQGVSRAGSDFKVSLYADDLLLYISDPVYNIPVIILMLERFGKFSGYKVNILKSVCYPINNVALQPKQHNIPFKLSRSGFKYLGINVICFVSSHYLNKLNQISVTGGICHYP